jgi:hypothetical protein
MSGSYRAAGPRESRPETPVRRSVAADMFRPPQGEEREHQAVVELPTLGFQPDLRQDGL